MSKPTETTNDRVPRDIVRFGKHTDCWEAYTDCREASGSVGVWFGEASGSVGGGGPKRAEGLRGGPKRAGGLRGGPKRAETRNGAHAGRGLVKENHK